MFSGKLWKFDDIESIAHTPASIGTDSRRSFCSHQLKWGRSLFKSKNCRRISKKFSSENLTKPTMLHVVVERWLHIENSLAFRFERFICVERKLPPIELFDISGGTKKIPTERLHAPPNSQRYRCGFNAEEIREILHQFVHRFWTFLFWWFRGVITRRELESA